MSDLALVAAAISSIINCPVKTYDECVADELEVLPDQILDLDLVHKYSFVREGDDEVVQKRPFRQGGKKTEKIVRRRPRQDGEKDEKVVHRRSRQDGEKDKEAVHRRSVVKQDDEKEQVNPDTNILPPQKIQIFVKTSFGRSHSIFVAPKSTVLELKQAVQKKLYINRPIRLGFSWKLLNDRKTIESYNIQRGNTIHILSRMLGGSGEYYVLKEDFLSPQYHYDFTNLNDDGTVYTRGKELYKRPYGWKRFALNVGKYDSDGWLGSTGNSSSEWPVSYHGTRNEFANNIADKGYLLSKGQRFAYGKGIYSTPEIHVSESYATQFIHGGANYRVVFQNRVNPVGLLKFDTSHGPYWVTPDEKNIRPYGLCIKKF